MNFFDSMYLQDGTSKQKSVLKVLLRAGILSILKAYTPVLAGTIPLDIDTKDSDIDIICRYTDASDFESKIREHFSQFNGFCIKRRSVNGIETVISNFKAEKFLIEIFGQNRPVREQEAVRHLLIEYEILQERGEIFKARIRELRKKGMKTEPAFAFLLGLEGDPYEALLRYRNSG